MLDLDKITLETVDEDENGWLIDDSSSNIFGGDTGIDADYEAMEEAIADIEEEYDSDTVSDYMNYGV
jgi:hypothetical protein